MTELELNKFNKILQKYSDLTIEQINEKYKEILLCKNKEDIYNKINLLGLIGVNLKSKEFKCYIQQREIRKL